MRESGFGVTVFQGEGKDSPRYRLDILTKRSRENELLQLIEEYEPNAFILSYEPTRFKGGFMEIMMKKQNRKRLDRNDADVLHESDEEASWLQKEKEKIVQEVRELRNSDQSILP